MHRALIVKLRALKSTTTSPLLPRISCRSLHAPRTGLASLGASERLRETDRRVSLARSFASSCHQLDAGDGGRPKSGKPQSASRRPTPLQKIYGTRDKRSKGSVEPAGRTQSRRSGTLGLKGFRKPVASKSPSSRPIRPDFREKEVLSSLISKLKLPTSGDVPNLPKDILENPVKAMAPAKAYLANIEENSSISEGKHKHTIHIDDLMVGGVLKIVGDGPSRTIAQKVANLQLLAELHEKNIASTLFPFRGETIDKEKDAILDVCLYAARYQDVPRITSQTVSLGKRKPSLSEVQIKLPLLGITASARARSQRNATVAAALNTKSAMERLVQDNDLSGKQLKDDEVFGLQSAMDFCQWYKYQNRGMIIDFRTRPVSIAAAGDFSSSVTIRETATDEERVFEPAQSSTKKVAENLAQLIAAVTITREQPALRSQFFQEYRRNDSQVLAPLTPLQFNIAPQTMVSIKKAIHASRHAAEQLEEDEDVANKSEQGRGTMYSPLPELIRQRRNDDLQIRQAAYLAREDLADLRKTRSEYPMNQYSKEVLKTIKSNTYSIVIGATGSGKTTQVPQILLNDAIAKGEGADCNIICTQPRRIAAKSVAQRVAEERAEHVGGSVGYHVKKDARTPQYGGSINYCTTGILSQQLQFASDDIMDNASHIIIDEVHERDTIIDFTLVTLKRLVKARIAEGKRVPHIILMSATIDADLFAGYLSIENAQGQIIDCPTLTVPGRTFPVKEFYLNEVLRKVRSSSTPGNLQRDPNTTKFLEFEQAFSRDNKTVASDDGDMDGTESAAIDWAAERRKATKKSNITVEEQEQALVPHALAASTIIHIAENTDQGAILTFLPGLDDITKINDTLRLPGSSQLDFNDESKFKIFMLHSSIANTQKEVFEPVPSGCRKIILATNIAETSITIPDVQHVVDTGKHRELQYDQTRRITKLACVWISKSNAKQRAGRAGRVQNGNYYALFSKERYESLRAVGLPELLRSDLQEVCLNVKNQGFAVPVKEFLSEAIEPPATESIDQALSDLVGLQALTEEEALTPLGKLLAQLPVHPSLGKMIVLGIIFRCLDPMLIIGASFSERSLFNQPIAARKEASEARANFSRSTLSDHIGLLAAVKELRMIDEVRGQHALRDYSMRHYLHLGAYKSILSTAETIEQLLVEHGVVPYTRKMNRAQFQFGDSRLNENSDKVGLIKALILAGFYPNLGIRRGRVLYRTTRTANALVYPRSINAVNLRSSKQKDPPPPDPKSELLSFSELVRSVDGNTLYLRETTPVTPLMSVLFSGKLEARSRNQVKMDGWLPFYLQDPSQVPPILALHNAMQNVTSSAFRDLAARRVLLDHEQRNRFADLLVEVLDADLIMFTSRSQDHRSFSRPRGPPTAAFNYPGSNNAPWQSDGRSTHRSPDALNGSSYNRNSSPGLASLAGGKNPLPDSVLGLFSEKSNAARAFRDRGY